VRCQNGECKTVHFQPVTLRDGTQYVTYQDVTSAGNDRPQRENAQTPVTGR
jgi:hypothetical protein